MESLRVEVESVEKEQRYQSHPGVVFLCGIFTNVKGDTRYIFFGVHPELFLLGYENISQ